MAQVASTALPPWTKIVAPAVAASGLPVTATHWVPCNTGLVVRCADATGTNARPATRPRTIQRRERQVGMVRRGQGPRPARGRTGFRRSTHRYVALTPP